MRPPVVVTGLGVVCSIGHTADALRRALEAGRSGIAALPDGAAPGDRAAIGAPVLELSLERELAARPPLPDDVRARALRTRRAPLPVQASLAAALEAAQDAALDRRPVAPARLGVVVAAGGGLERLHHDAAAQHARSPAYVSPRYPLHALDTDHVGTISEVLGARGEGFAVGGASAGGNVAILKAAQAIELGLVDACLAVGALVDLAPAARAGFANLGALGGKRFGDAPARACRPFDRRAEGFVYGQGSACLVLESAASAEARGARARARLLGGALVVDGNRGPDPDEAGEARAMTECLARAGLDPRDVDYVNAHGSSSPLGDQTEVRAIRRALGEGAARAWINSTKGLVGHCLVAAGAVEAVATVLQLEHGFVHPSANLDEPIDPVCRFAGARAERAPLRVALSSSFGFGGINTCIALARGDA